jgi:hypothetical protein
VLPSCSAMLQSPWAAADPRRSLHHCWLAAPCPGHGVELLRSRFCAPRLVLRQACNNHKAHWQAAAVSCSIWTCAWVPMSVQSSKQLQRCCRSCMLVTQHTFTSACQDGKLRGKHTATWLLGCCST